MRDVNIAVANLPWGKNAADYFGQNELIISRTCKLLQASYSGLGFAAFIVPSSSFDFNSYFKREPGLEVEEVVSLGVSEVVLFVRASYIAT